MEERKAEEGRRECCPYHLTGGSLPGCSRRDGGAEREPWYLCEMSDGSLRSLPLRDLAQAVAVEYRQNNGRPLGAEGRARLALQPAGEPQARLFVPGEVPACPECHRPVREGQAVQGSMFQAGATEHASCLGKRQAREAGRG